MNFAIFDLLDWFTVFWCGLGLLFILSEVRRVWREHTQEKTS